MSIDLYPYLDVQRVIATAPTAVGAASLLYQNQNNIYPEFAGRDLVSLWPALQHVNFAVDGATTLDILAPLFAQKLEPYTDAAALVTITLAGNDALGLLTKRGEYDAKAAVEEITQRYDAALNVVARAIPTSQFVLTTIYDPSDGTGNLPGFTNDRSWVDYLDIINNHIRNYAKSTGTPLADVHAHFLGHGLSAKPEDRWYWHANPIEPSAKGASEIRRLWFDAIREHVGY